MMIDVEYERVKKKCYHCFRLSHEKQVCPLLKGLSTGDGRGKGKQNSVQMQRLSHRQHNTTLSADIMPLLAPSVPPGFAPPTGLIAPEVFEEMQVYMNCHDPEERRIREFRMKRTLDALSKDSIAQRAGLRMEDAPVISNTINKDKGLVFDYRKVDAGNISKIGEASSHTEEQNRREPPTNCLAISNMAERNQNVEKRIVHTQHEQVTGERSNKNPRIADVEHKEDDGTERAVMMGQGNFEIGCNFPVPISKSGGSKSYQRKATSWK